MKRSTKLLAVVLASALSLSVGATAASAHGGRHGGAHSDAYCDAAACPGTHGGYGHRSHSVRQQCHEAWGENCPQDCPLHGAPAN